MAKIRISLELEVDPFTADELAKEGFEDEATEPDEITPITAHEIGDCIAGHLPFEVEAFAGSNLFVHVRKAKLVGAELVEEETA